MVMHMLLQGVPCGGPFFNGIPRKEAGPPWLVEEAGLSCFEAGQR